MLRIGANLSSALRWALVVELSKRKQYTRNKKRFRLIAATQIGLLVPSFALMLAVLLWSCCSDQEQQDDYECANLSHVCSLQNYSFTCVTVFHIHKLLVSPCHNICYHSFFEK